MEVPHKGGYGQSQSLWTVKGKASARYRITPTGVGQEGARGSQNNTACYYSSWPQVTIGVWVHFWVFNSIPLVYFLSL